MTSHPWAIIPPTISTLMIEAKKVAFVDRTRYISDPETVKIPVEELLSKDYAAKRRSLIRPDRAADVSAILPGKLRPGYDLPLRRR